MQKSSLTNEEKLQQLPDRLVVNVDEPSLQDILQVSDPQVAASVCQQLLKISGREDLPQDVRVFGCDTEFTGWRMKDTMVGNGRVICFSIYSHTPVAAGKGSGAKGRQYHYIWVNCDLEVPGRWRQTGRLCCC